MLQKKCYWTVHLVQFSLIFVKLRWSFRNRTLENASVAVCHTHSTIIFAWYLQFSSRLQYNCWKEISTFAEHFSTVRLGMTQNVTTRLNLCTFINCLLPWFRFIFYVHVYSLSILPYQFVITHSVLFTLCVCVCTVYAENNWGRITATPFIRRGE